MFTYFDAPVVLVLNLRWLQVPTERSGAKHEIDTERAAVAGAKGRRLERAQMGRATQ